MYLFHGTSLSRLHAQIDGLAAQSGRAAAQQPAAVPAQAQLIDLLTVRGDVLGRIADYELAAELAERLVRDAPQDGTAWLARAKTRATFHRFAMALDDVDAPGHTGLGPAVTDARRTATLQAAGYHADALVLCADAVKRGPGFPIAGPCPSPGPPRPDRGGPGRPRGRYRPAASAGLLQR